MGVNSSDNLVKFFEEVDNVAEERDQTVFLKHSSLSNCSSNCILTEAEEDLTNGNSVVSKLSRLLSTESASAAVDGIDADLRKSVPRLKIAMLVVGTRGDVQPFVAVAKKLQAYMARNKGLPLAKGELTIQRKQLEAIMESILPACTEPDIKTGAPFRAQAIIANPPAYGQLHVAEALNVPLHILFTVPWTPTYEFPIPIAHLPQSPGNRLSYVIVDLMIWWLIRGHINDIRKRKLNLPPISYFSTYYGSTYHLPTTYMWSRYVLPKPKDWGPEVDVVGYCFLNLGSKYQPQEELVDWIKKGPRPIYVGFGSMLLDDSKRTTDIILEALKHTGQRGIIDCGWGGLGISSELPDDVFLLENCPHDWLFPQCSAVVHHGGGGTTAAGLKAGCPTTIVPFFGDQFFWGERIHEKGLGPEPIPVHELTVEALSNAIEFMLEPEVKCRAMEIARLIDNEDGVAAAVDAFHRHLPNELPVPPASMENNCPNLIQWFFVQIGTICCGVCS
uniref:Uncharacterized protein n=1 Tax=Chenopodium quinoa TaxID=63459 RepID=A0A803LHZ6_CHEQI